jgi:exodeoxyribonuclease III
MKLISYNLNGIRAAVKKGLVEWLQTQDFDFVGIQETKAWDSDIPKKLFEALGYHTFWHSAEKKGYSGVGILTKKRPDKVVIGCGIERYDREGRVLRADFGDLTIVNCYFPSGTSGDERQSVKMDFLNDIQQWVNELRQTRPKVILMGDYNVAHHEIDVYNPDKARKFSGFLPEERAWLTRWFEAGFVDAFRQTHPTQQQFSWWSYRGGNRPLNRGWRIDYHALTENLAPQIVACQQLTDVVHSDHCPVFLEIQLPE